MENKRKIWMFHHYATPPTKNGMVRPYNFGIKLKEANYSIKIFASSFLHYSNVNMIKNKDLYIIDDEHEIPFIYVKSFPSNGNGLSRVINIYTYYKNLFDTTKSLLKTEDKPDLIIASSPHPLTMVAGIQIAKKLGIPCVSEVRDFWPEVFFVNGKVSEKGILGKLLVKGEHWIYKNSNAIIFLKEGDYTYITDKKWDINQGGDIDLEKCFYINNGVNLSEFEKQTQKDTLLDEDLESGKFSVVYAGAIRPVNNVENILDAAKLLSKYENIQFLIYGDGNQVDKLKMRIKNEGIRNIKLKGYVDKKYIPYILSKSSVNILNYSQDKYNWSRGNSSNKLFEYMASGKPVISTVKMGYSPIEKYKCGISLNEDSPEALAEGIINIYNMTDKEYLSLSNNAREGVKEFDYKNLTQKLILVMERLMK